MKKMQRLYKLYPPAQNLGRHDLPNGTKRIPVTQVPDRQVLFGPKNDFDPMEDGPYLRNYGWAFTDAFAFDYARRHSLELDLSTYPSLMEPAGRAVIRFAELADDPPEKQKPRLWANLRVMVCDVVLEHIEREMGFSLDLGDPFCGEYTSMIVLYTNYNIVKRHWIIERITRRDVQETIEKLNKIMTPPGEQEERQPLWWYDRENPIVRVSPPLYAIDRFLTFVRPGSV